MSNDPRTTLTSIQYLRGLAALAVVAMHTGWTYSGIGAAGVDVFFVISGFIMVHVSRREVTPTVFLRARVLRVVPLYWLLTLVGVALAGLDDIPRILASLAFWPHAGFDGRDYPVLIPGWTLNYEVFFYLAFAVTLLLQARLRLPVLSLGLAGLVALGIAIHPAQAAAATYTGPLLLEFLGGAWLCQAWQRGWVPRGRWGLALSALGALVLLAQAGIGPFEGWRCLTWGLPSLLIVAGALGAEAGGRLPRILGLRQMGDASYALYLTHLMVQKPLLPILHPLPLPMALPLVILTCVAVALAVHRWVEVPLGAMLRPKRRTLVASSAPNPAKQAHDAGFSADDSSPCPYVERPLVQAFWAGREAKREWLDRAW